MLGASSVSSENNDLISSIYSVEQLDKVLAVLTVALYGLPVEYLS
jgi:hypothetical protein